jgi:hypothetical protein
MAKCVAWTDGTRWEVDDDTFARTTARLDAVAPMVWGLEPILARWKRIAAAGDRIDVDALAPSEDDRAIVTAGLERAVDETSRAGATECGFDDAEAFGAFLTQLEALHRLFATDVTYER